MKVVGTIVLIIRPCDIFLGLQIPYIGSTSDDICGDDTNIEVKCPLTAFKMGKDNKFMNRGLKTNR